MKPEEIQSVRRGDALRDREGVRWTATTDARTEDEGQTWKVWLLSLSGQQSARLATHNAFEFDRS